jgi:hypothetical protein
VSGGLRDVDVLDRIVTSSIATVSPSITRMSALAAVPAAVPSIAAIAMVVRNFMATDPLIAGSH